MENISSQIPAKLLENPNVYKFSSVIDQLNLFKQQEMYRYGVLWNHHTSFDNFTNFLYENGQLPYLQEAPKWLLIRFIENAYSIFTKKGTPDGLDLFALSVCDGTVRNVDFSGWYAPRMLQLNDLNYGTLPNGVDLTTPDNINYLFGNSFAFYYGRVQLDIVGDYMTLPETRRTIMVLLVDILPMCYPGTTSITVNFYDKTNTLLETINY